MEKTKTCPVSTFTKMLGGKWKLNIINTIRKNDKLRFGKLHLLISTISRKVLSDQLKELEKDNLIIRTQFPEIPPRVEYSLTEASINLYSVFNEIENWSDTFIQLKQNSRV
ncbi:MAG: helix-turn-helix domain-containing protein [Flavobacteriaceae bacterium]|nr:helix-turn-helix domain-containing protein [Flavobacteriaceae bacterium]